MTIQLVIPSQPPRAKPDPTEVTFRGIWPVTMAADLEQSLAEIRAESDQKLERLATELEEALAAKS